MAVEFARVDDRLLHGQVVTTWIKALQIEQCIVVNAAIAADSFQRQLLEMAAPEGMRVVFFAPEKFAEVAAQNPIKRRTMLLFNHPRDVLCLIQLGFKLNALNIGGMKNDGKKRQITKAVAVNEDDAALLQGIADAGVSVTIQMVPADTAIPLEKVNF
jgi:PTS system mannose-specific IIB component